MTFRPLECLAAITVLAALGGTLRAQAAAGSIDAAPEGLRPWVSLSYPPSTLITGIEFFPATRVTRAPGSDIWPITWAADNHQYSAFGDGGGFGGTNRDGRVSLGVSRIEGGPDNYVGRNVWGGHDAENPATFGGKGTGLLAVGGVLFMWVAGPDSLTVPTTQLAVSRDRSRSWQLADWRWTMQDGIYAGSFINFGQGYADAADDYVYAVFVRLNHIPDEPRNWRYETPGRIDLARVPQNRILEQAAWVWFTGVDQAGRAQWTKNMSQRQSVFEDPNGIKVVSIAHHARLGRYLLTYNPRDTGGNFALFEAPRPWGPWSRVDYRHGYAPFLPPSPNQRVSIFHFAPKWWSADGREFTLVFNPGDDSWNTMRGRLVLAK